MIRSANRHNNPTEIYLSEKEGQQKCPAKEGKKERKSLKNPKQQNPNNSMHDKINKLINSHYANASTYLSEIVAKAN